MVENVVKLTSDSPRQLPSWIEGFYKYTEGKGSPSLFRRWAGIFAVGAALERRVYVRTAKGVLYPNMYVVKVGPPGAGKTLATSLVYDLLSTLTPDFHLAPTSVTKASLIDALYEAERRIVRPMETPSVNTFHSMTIASDELGVLLPAYENDFMNVLTNIYDGRIYRETRRTKSIDIKMESPLLSILAATTPSFLNQLLPEGAWDQGFLSRTMLIYSGGEEQGDLFAENTYDTKLWKSLEKDLASIFKMYGRMTFTAEAAETMGEWHLDKKKPMPDHPKLLHYNTRRTAHLLKLCMIAAASAGQMVIALDHFAEALDWLTEAESHMEDIFKSMKTGGDTRVIEDAYHYVYKHWVTRKVPMIEAHLIEFISQKTPAHNIMRVLEVMVNAGALEKVMTPAGYGYKPKPKTSGL